MIFHRSLIKELANSSGVAFTVLFSIVVTVGLVRILGDAVSGRIDPSSVFEIVIYTSLTYLPPLLSLSLFAAVLIVLIRAWQDSEMIVWFSSGGLNLFAWCRPILIFSLPLILAIGTLSVYISPWAKQQIDRAGKEFSQRDDVSRITPGKFIESGNGRRILFVEQADPSGTYIRNVFLSERQGEKELVLQAESGEIRTNDKGERYVRLNNGRRYETSANKDAAWKVSQFQQYEVRIEVKVDSVYESTDTDYMTIEELFLRGTRSAQAQILWRFSWPLVALNLVLLAIPLSFVNPRAGRSLSLIFAVLVFILYLNGISVMQTWVKAGKFTWMSGLLTINGVVLAITCLLFVRRVWMQRWIPYWLTQLPKRLFAGEPK